MPKSFITDTEVVAPATNTEQMMEVDRITIEEAGPSLYQLIEDAGRNLAEAAIQEMENRWR